MYLLYIIIIGYVTSNLDRISYGIVYNIICLYYKYSTILHTRARKPVPAADGRLCAIVCISQERNLSRKLCAYAVILLLRYCRRRPMLRSLEQTRPGAKVFDETVTVYTLLLKFFALPGTKINTIYPTCIRM